MPFPSIKTGWDQRVLENNKLLLSILNIDKNQIKKVAPYDADATADLMSLIINQVNADGKNFNYIVAPLGTKPQVLGIYKYWRLNPNQFSLLYPTPIHYKDTPEGYPTENLWLIDNSREWEEISLK